MKNIYVDATQRRRFTKLPDSKLHTLDFDLAIFAGGSFFADVLYRFLDTVREKQDYRDYADTLIGRAAYDGNVAVMEALLDYAIGTPHALDAVCGLRFKTVDFEPGHRPRREARGSAPEPDPEVFDDGFDRRWKPMMPGYSTTLPIHQTISVIKPNNVSMQALLVERHGSEQLHVCMRPGDWLSRKFLPDGGFTPFMRALQLGQIESASWMLRRDPSVLHDVTTERASIGDLLVASAGQEAPIQGSGHTFMRAYFAAQEARRVVDEVDLARSPSGLSGPSGRAP